MVNRPHKGSTRNIVDLRMLFLSLQNQLISRLQTNREIIKHPGAKGEATEVDWSGMLSAYLPHRYQVSKAFVVDCRGNLSDQIDIVIYDRQYSPFLFNQDGTRYVPAESVYAIFEVKQSLDKAVMEYARAKAASVRRLKRTSAPIAYAGGIFSPRKPFYILAGVLCLESQWEPVFGKPFRDCFITGKTEERLDLGCVLRRGGFDAGYSKKAVLHVSAHDTALIFFFLHLMQKLQHLGTAPAIDLLAYAKIL
jgi:hypothetical protein